ncbi:hypothetical protein L226DRAFT_576238 [Lentinus tigrinus ALCF2SS1-7]|uniref:Uncharacterized protein n=1 Tax=Lentinus tigrinus ALCF2SS1-6 TaxID=1328759 RepID=A0A5C2RQL7_9APHY|nr:hypothetical protein L227DRAFT_617021 [Lentinus tigrinus ALCF2SS1-6]RPD68685.1 hypothetical protein L226DRAFT_576238 [Lentinus tigrinus ALCF2SS1-7]
MNNNPHTVDAFDDDALLALRNATPSDRASKRSSQVVAARRASLPITPISPSGSSLSLSRRGAGPHMPHLAPSPVPPSSRATDTPYDPFNPVRPPTLARTSNVAVSGSCGSSMTRRTDTGMEPVPEDSYTGDYAETRSLQLPPPPGFPDQSHARWSQHSLNHHGHSFLPDAPPSRPPSSTSGRRVALPLTAAFQTSVLRSGNGPSTLSAGASSQKQRYPSIPMSPTPRTRSRPSSVSVSMSGAPGASAATPPSVPGADIMEPPTEALRRMSTSDATYRQPRFRGPAREDDPIGRSHLPSDVRNASPGPSSFRHAMVYHPPPTHASNIVNLCTTTIKSSPTLLWHRRASDLEVSGERFTYLVVATEPSAGPYKESSAQRPEHFYAAAPRCCQAIIF